MTKRIITKIGDIFFVKLSNGNKKYFQYIANDLTQLNSDVIRVFKNIYPINFNPDILEVVNSEVEFYAHCVIKLGVKMEYWEKIGNSMNLGNLTNIIFRSSGDTPQTKISQNWWIWKLGKEQKLVGKLEDDNRNAEVGSVIPPDSIVYRMQTGAYDFVYPDFE